MYLSLNFKYDPMNLFGLTGIGNDFMHVCTSPKLKFKRFYLVLNNAIIYIVVYVCMCVCVSNVQKMKKKLNEMNISFSLDDHR